MDFSFKEFIVESKEVEETLESLPKSHQKLVKPYKISFESGHTLKNDKENVGYMDPKTKKIVIASPWNYSRSFTFLHEIAHIIYMHKMTPALKKEWSSLAKKIKNKYPKESALQQNDEEVFAMAYATNYSSHPPVVFNHKIWLDFIKRIPN